MHELLNNGLSIKGNASLLFPPVAASWINISCLETCSSFSEEHVNRLINGLIRTAFNKHCSVMCLGLTLCDYGVMAVRAAVQCAIIVCI